MLKKRLGTEAIEWAWYGYNNSLINYFKIPSTLIIPEGCERIGCSAFSHCKILKEVVISGSVKEIRNCSFYDCENLEKVIIPESVEKIGDVAFFNCCNATIILKKPKKKFTIGVSAFEGCKSIEYVKEEVGN